MDRIVGAKLFPKQVGVIAERATHHIAHDHRQVAQRLIDGGELNLDVRESLNGQSVLLSIVDRHGAQGYPAPSLRGPLRRHLQFPAGACGKCVRAGGSTVRRATADS
jgi:hypothetical protein